MRLSALGAAPRVDGREPPAPVAEVEGALDQLREALLAIGYLNPDNPEAILAELRHLLTRRGLTAREATLVRGIARQALWSARQGGRGDPPA
jgi:tRNA/rRNA methyltransferase